MQLNTPMKVVLAVVIIFLIGIGFYLLDYQKKFAEEKQLTTQLNDKKEQLKRDEKLVEELPVLLKKKEQRTAELQQLIREQLPTESPEDFVPSYITEIEKLVIAERERMGDEEFKILTITPGQMTAASTEKRKKSDEGGEERKIEALTQFPKRMFSMNLTGRYATLIDFLHQLASLKLKRLVTINKLSLSVQSLGEPGQSPVLSITIPVTAYLHQGSSSTSTTKEGGGGE